MFESAHASPSHMTDPVVRGLAAVEVLAGEHLGALVPQAACDRLREVAHLAERTEAMFVALVAEWDASGAWSGDEHPTASAAWWLAVHARVSRARAARLLRAADLIRTFERTSEALASGCIKVGHVRCSRAQSLPSERCSTPSTRGTCFAAPRSSRSTGSRALSPNGPASPTTS